MANRIWVKLLGSLTPGLVTLTGRVVLGATGAISSQAKCRGFSLARVSAGLYTVTLADSYNELHVVEVTVVTAGAVPAANKAVGFTVPVSTDTVSAGTGKTFQIQLLQASGAAGEADDSGELRISIQLVNSSRTF